MSASDHGPSAQPTLIDSTKGLARESADVGAGQRVGRYVVLETLGAGGMGVVFAAYDPELDRKVAVKLLSDAPEDTKRSSEGQQRLLREARALAQLTHPNIVTVHDVGTFEARVFMAMEFVQGETVRRWVKREHGWREVLDVLGKAGRGLAAVHAAGLVHRDFKPENVMVADDGRVLVMDFGLVRSTATESDFPLLTASGEDSERPITGELGPISSLRLTRPGARPGTVLYMAPEQHVGLECDARTDQFGFCLVLFEALFGKRAFRGATRMDLSDNVIAGRIVDVGSSPVPARVRKVVVRGLSQDPDDRWPSMEALLDELGRDPSARRRRWLTIGAGTVVAAVGVASLLQLQQREQEHCIDAAGRIDRVWSPPRGQLLAEAFESTKVSYAVETWERINPILGAYAQAWSTQYADACEAALVRGDESEELYQQRIVCLSRRLGELDALISVFEQADANVVEKSIEAAGNLAPLAPCGDPAYLLSRVKPPADLDTAVAVDRVRERLVEVRAWEQAGRYQQAHAAALELASESRKLEYRPLVGEVELRIGLLEHVLGRYSDARAALERGVFAARSAGDDELEARIEAHLVYIVGSELADIDAALSWANLARATIERLGPSHALEPVLLDNLGKAHRRAGNYDEAVAHGREALALWEVELGTNHPRVAAALNHLGNALKAQGHIEEALLAQERALSIREQTFGPNHPTVATSLNNIGNLLKHLRKLDQAHDHLQRAIEIRTSAYGSQHPAVAASMHNLANVLVKQNQLDEALRYRHRALAIRERVLGPGHPDVASSLGTLANTLAQLGRLDEAVGYQEIALRRLRATFGPAHPAVATSLFNLGNTHLGRDANRDALTYYLEAIEVYEQTVGARHPDLIDPEYGAGQALRRLERADQAVVHLGRAVELADAHRQPALARAELRFALAKGQWESGARERGRALANEAKGMLATEAEPPSLLGKIETWLAER